GVRVQGPRVRREERGGGKRQDLRRDSLHGVALRVREGSARIRRQARATPRSPTRWYGVTSPERRSSAATTSGPSPLLRAATRPCASTIADTPVGVARTSARRFSIARKRALTSCASAACGAPNQ